MNALLPASFNGGVSKHFANDEVVDDLSSGIQSSFGIVGYKGKVWSIRYRGDEEQLMRDDGDGARGSIEVVIVDASKAVSKIWYEQGYVEGSNAAPDCFSNNGVAPEPTSAKPQCATCAACKHNAWGSRITPAGKQGKACSDSKRIAVVPMIDIPNEAYGGPMLLRVPAASLQDIATYGGKMQQMGYPYYSVATRIAFDPDESYPKFKFSAIRPLSDDEAELIKGYRGGHQIERILSENEFANTPAASTPAAEEPLFEQPPEEDKPVTSKGNTDTTKADEDAKAAAEAKKKADAAAKKKADNAAKKKAMEEEAARLEAEAAQAAEGGAEEEESEEDKELREMEERLAAARAKKAAAAATTASGSQQSEPAKTVAATKSEAGHTATTTASPSDEPADEDKSAFESDLDNMLDGLLDA